MKQQQQQYLNPMPPLFPYSMPPFPKPSAAAALFSHAAAYGPGAKPEPAFYTSDYHHHQHRIALRPALPLPSSKYLLT
jgi:hypothetical protein